MIATRASTRPTASTAAVQRTPVVCAALRNNNNNNTQFRTAQQASGFSQRRCLATRSVSVDAEVVDVTSAPTRDVAVPKKKIKGRTVVVTGGSQGSGKATALSFAKRGFNVVVAARQPERLQQVADMAQGLRGGAPGTALAVPTDISDPASVKALFDAVAATYEQVDVLVNCAGVCLTGPFEETTVDDFGSQMSINFFGHVAATQAFLPMLKAGGGGSIVMVNSFGGVIPLRNMTAYTASKFALDGFSKALSYELKDQGVHVGQVHPGVIASDFMERSQFRGPKADAGRQTMQSMLSTGIAQQPQEIADAVMEVVDGKKCEVVVGPVFKAAVGAYRLTGANPFAVSQP
ncbi:hypothetical protein FOA52_010130 [Chlamydomonas sp. UWO 241]|nr:hypothetical protein FOA52_010130 [Chlamydomonas sp. UWO 241]